MNKLNSRTYRGRAQRGVAIVEALVAAVILGIGLVGTVAMQARSYAALAEAGQRAEAAIQAEKLVGLMSNDAAHIDDYKVALGGAPTESLRDWAEGLDAVMPGAKFGVTLTNTGYQQQVDIEIRWTRRKGDAENQHLVTSYVKNPDVRPIPPVL